MRQRVTRRRTCFLAVSANELPALALLVILAQPLRAQGSGSIGGTILGMAERAGSAFDRVLARETGIAGVSSPINADASKLRELQEMARAHRIDERLAALKAANPTKR